MNKLTELELAHEKGRLLGMKQVLEKGKFSPLVNACLFDDIKTLEQTISTAVIEPAEDDGKRKARELVSRLEPLIKPTYNENWIDAIEESIFHINQLFNLSEGK